MVKGARVGAAVGATVAVAETAVGATVSVGGTVVGATVSVGGTAVGGTAVGVGVAAVPHAESTIDATKIRLKSSQVAFLFILLLLNEIKNRIGIENGLFLRYG
jgi:hypothetical protein